MTYAVIKTGGKQYLVTENQTLKIEKIVGEVGQTVTLDQVLMVADKDGKNVELGQPVLAGTVVLADVLAQGRARKIDVVHYKAKTRYHKVYGHRQAFTQIKIKSIGKGEAKPVEAKKPAAKKAVTTKKPPEKVVAKKTVSKKTSK